MLAFPCRSCGEETSESGFGSNQLKRAKRGDEARCKACTATAGAENSPPQVDKAAELAAFLFRESQAQSSGSEEAHGEGQGAQGEDPT